MDNLTRSQRTAIMQKIAECYGEGMDIGKMLLTLYEFCSGMLYDATISYGEVSRYIHRTISIMEEVREDYEL